MDRGTKIRQRGRSARLAAEHTAPRCRSRTNVQMSSQRQYHVISGRRVVATQAGPSAREAALDYLRALGCKRDEIVYYGVDGVSWRGAIYRAELVEPPASSRS